MLIYSGTKKSFTMDVLNGVIGENVERRFAELGLRRESKSEYRSWQASLPRMALALANSDMDDDVAVALEYQIPLTAKRVDFIVGGVANGRDSVVIVELKQWENCGVTSIENVVNTFVGGANRNVPHPSYQVYSYARLIENFNEDIRLNDISLVPCAYLHNFPEENRASICDTRYQRMIDDAPVFLKEDGMKLVEFISRHVKKPSKKNLFDIIENGKLKPSKSLQDMIGRIINGRHEFDMIDEQQVAFAAIMQLVEKKIDDGAKHTIIVEGGPGTGKSVIAINLLAKILQNNQSCAFVSRSSALRATFSKALIKGEYTLGFLKGLFKGSGTLLDVAEDTFDCLIVDEAHRLRAKSGLYGNKGENQILEIIRSARISVFFIDENQTVDVHDIGTIEEIRRQAKRVGSIVHAGDDFRLTSQFRCNGSDGYMAFIDDVLQIRDTANYDGFDMDYDIRVFDDPCEMREALREKNGSNKARMIAGYCYPWVSDKNPGEIDIRLPGGFAAQWNFNTEDFASDANSFEQVGCIHSTQGLEFEYVGIIVGTDMVYANGRVETDYKKRYRRRDKTIGKVTTPEERKQADRIIRNTYRTLLTRGQKGCFIYCEDEPLRDYLRQRLAARKQVSV